MRLQVENKYKILFIIFVVLAVYYPAISGGINSLDDVHIIDLYGVNGNLKLQDILLPGNKFYYRPIIELSYYYDNFLWSMDARFMHLENIFIHAINAVLIFLIASQVAGSCHIRRVEFPLLTALLFALHPLHTEAISWIAGRTDPLAALFVLLATYHIIAYLKENKRSNFYLAIVFSILGCLTKEVAFFFIPAAAVMIFYWPGVTISKFWFSLKKRFVAVLFAVVTLAVGFMFIYLRVSSGMNSVSKLFEGSSSLAEIGEYSLRVFGFYVKKIFVPLPLNYATVTIDHGYFFIGCISVIVIAFLIMKRNICSAFIISTALLLIPALLVAVFKVAWTPVSERYLYLPLAFFTIGFICSCYSFMEKVGKGGTLSVSLAVLLLPAGLIVVQRNVVWQDNLALYQDCVKKSPNFGRLRNELAVALIKKGYIEEGRKQLEIGRRINEADVADRWFYLNQIALKLKGKQPEEARIILHNSFTDKETADAKILIMLSQVDEERLVMAKDMQMIRAIASDLIDTNNYIYAKIKEPLRLYRNGQLALIMGNRKVAGEYFMQAYRNAPVEAFYRAAAAKMAEKCGKQ